MSPRPKKNLEGIKPVSSEKPINIPPIIEDKPQVNNFRVEVKGKPFYEAPANLGDEFSTQDESVIFNANPKYAYRWKNKNKMASNMHDKEDVNKGAVHKGWKVINKKHSDFEGLRTVVDETPDNTMFTRGDLVLACMPIEMYKRRQEKKVQKRKSDVTKFENSVRDTMARVSKDGIKSISKLDSALERMKKED